MNVRVDLSGKRFGKLAVLNREETRKGRSYFKCLCDCGKTVVVSYSNLKYGRTKSCGCLVIGNKYGEKNKKHGMSFSRLYVIRAEMLARCYNKNKKQYVNYGGRGIEVCEDWKDKENGFKNFYNWAVCNGYKDNLTIDRINNDGNYCPQNCRWITMEEQNNNRRNNVFFKKGDVVQNAKKWSEQLGINIHTFYGWFYRNSKKVKDFKMLKGIKNA